MTTGASDGSRVNVVKVIDARPRVVVSPTQPARVQVIDARPRLVVSPAQPARVVSVGVQGPAGPVQPVPGVDGDVLFNSGDLLAVDSENFNYSLNQQALTVRKIVGTTLDGGNF